MQVHLEGSVRAQTAAIHAETDRVLEAGLRCHPSFPGPPRAGLLTRQGRWGPVAYEVTIPFSTWRG